MFKFDTEVAEGAFKGHTLILPAVTVGNVGQLVTDLVIANLEPPPQKIGRVFHPALESVIGTDVISNGSTGLMTSCEIYHQKERLVLLIHFHSPVNARGRQDFMDFFMDWIERQRFKQVICLSSVLSTERVDSQLVGLPFRFLATQKTPAAITQQFSRLECTELESRRFPAPAVILDSVNNLHEKSGKDTSYLPGGGLTKYLFQACQSKEIPFLALLMFASEGDNTPEAMTMFHLANEVFQFTGSSESAPLTIPFSWSQLYSASETSLY